MCVRASVCVWVVGLNVCLCVGKIASTRIRVHSVRWQKRSKNILTSSGLAKMVWSAIKTTKSRTIFKLIRTINKAKFIIIYKSLTVPREELPGWHTDVNVCSNCTVASQW